METINTWLGEVGGTTGGIMGRGRTILIFNFFPNIRSFALLLNYMKTLSPDSGSLVRG